MTHAVLMHFVCDARGTTEVYRFKPIHSSSKEERRRSRHSRSKL